ncbi:MAG: hypothetical protein WA775_03360 [Psychroserpens sp.]|uniref:hypothetical protein n=1 Tax=Psychroserpens sp. TaxID=2020870 RepID=UPI003C7FE99B
MQPLKKISFKLITLLTVLTFLFTCSQDDDVDSNITTLEILTSDKWYFQSKSPGTYTECNRKGFLDFSTDGTVSIRAFDDTSDDCGLEVVFDTTYTLNGLNIDVEIGSDSIIGIIAYDPSVETITIINSEGDSITFDKIEG